MWPLNHGIKSSQDTRANRNVMWYAVLRDRWCGNKKRIMHNGGDGCRETSSAREVGKHAGVRSALQDPGVLEGVLQYRLFDGGEDESDI